jgi:mannosidase alpha-like ER degradation enhancer 2
MSCGELWLFLYYNYLIELAESVWYLYQSTGSDIMIKIGLSIVEAIDKISRVPCGFATVKNCLDHTLSDRMESYFLAETLKYLYLLFDPDNPFSLDPQTSFNVSERLSDGVGGAKQLFSGRVLRDGCSVGKSGYVFSTEAHPIDVGSLHCCKDRWKGHFHDDGGYHGNGYHDDIGLTPNHGCPAKSFTSRLEVYSVIRDKN